MTGNAIDSVPKTTVVQDYMIQSPDDGAKMREEESQDGGE